MAVIAAIILVVVSYFGFYNLSLVDSLKSQADRYGPVEIHSAVLLIGILPIGVGFVVGFIISMLV